jgi:hypothetical protein
MLELGDASERFHRELAEPLAAAKVDRVFLVGEAVGVLYDALPKAKRGGLWSTADAAMPGLLSFLRSGDVVTVKGSRGVGLGRIVERLRAESARQRHDRMFYYVIPFRGSVWLSICSATSPSDRGSGGHCAADQLSSPVHCLAAIETSHGQPIRPDGPNGHIERTGTPTMGGFLILLA